ncbi:hypothetical protein ACOSQ4_002979 [Xanthoceras sorbifolium]
MNNRRLVVICNGQWDGLNYVGGSSLGVLVSKRLKFTGLVELIYQKFHIDRTRYDISINTVVLNHNPRKLQIMGNDDVAFLLQERTLNISEVYVDLLEKVDNNVTDPPPFGTQFSAAGESTFRINSSYIG